MTTSKKVQERIDFLTKTVKIMKESANPDQAKIADLTKQLSQCHMELTRLKKIEWEETHERLNIDD